LPNLSEGIVIVTVVCGAAAAAAIDLRTRRVPNPLTALLASMGIVFGALRLGGLTPGAAAAGLGLGFLLMLPGHVIGRTGAGDVKLFAAMGALIGPAHILTAFFYTAIAGGALALIVAAWRRRLGRSLRGVATLAGLKPCATDAESNVAQALRPAGIDDPIENNRFAYAPAIALGTVIAALGA
jgi:prepilin peptidase CpaA